MINLHPSRDMAPWVAHSITHRLPQEWCPSGCTDTMDIDQLGIQQIQQSQKG